MITIRKSGDRGHANYGWLDAHYSFSFGSYNDPAHMGFSELRVLNQDTVQPGQGFGTHGHRDMEIVTYVLSGTLEHKDSMGNGSTIRPGEVQLMSAGSGVTHSEFNASNSDELHLLQMWILPRSARTKPRYEQKEFPAEDRTGRLLLVVSPNGADGSLTIGQDVRLFVGTLHDGDTWGLSLAEGRKAYLHVAEGHVTLNGERLGPGDGAAIESERNLELTGAGGEVVLWDLPE